MTNGGNGYVLVIDDDEDIRETIRAVLEIHGYRAESASDGADALRWLRSHATPPSLILLDLMMPNVNGVEFREAQLKDPALADLPTVVLTGAALIDRGGPLRGVEVLKKPIDLQSLLTKVKQFLPAE